MAKVKKVNSWLENKIAKIRKLARPQAARFYRATKKFGSLGVIIFMAGIAVISFFLPKDRFQQVKERLIRNPSDFEAHLILIEEFLKNNQLEEAERSLRLAQQHLRGGGAPELSSGRHLGGEMILGEQANTKLNELWQQKHYSDPKDIHRLITSWEKITEEKPNYRDGYFQLAYLHYKIFENEKAKEYLEKALELDPNYKPAKELEEIIR